MNVIIAMGVLAALLLVTLGVLIGKWMFLNRGEVIHVEDLRKGKYAKQRCLGQKHYLVSPVNKNGEPTWKTYCVISHHNLPDSFDIGWTQRKIAVLPVQPVAGEFPDLEIVDHVA